MRYIFLFLIFSFSLFCFSQNPDPLLSKDVQAQQKWVDSIYNGMTLKEKIGQLFMIQVYSEKEKGHEKMALDHISKYNIGGIIYTSGGPLSQAHLDNKLQAASKIPLLIGMDAEWGLSMRLDSTYSFPWNMTLGAIKDLDLVERTGMHIGEHCKRLGVHFNFAPVVDINTNPNNPIIGCRSFGEQKENVTAKSLAFMKGMQEAGVLANAKHFPGHGDTNSDSHKTLPTVSFSKERIKSVELYPYRELIKKGLSSVMVAHLHVPSLESRRGYPSSISKKIVTKILKDDLGFKGLIFTDALNMKGASNFKNPGDIDLAAFLAGNDVLLISENVPKGILKITEAYTKGKITEERLAHSVKKILKAKYKVELHNYQPININNLKEDINRLEDDLLSEELYENAITVVKNKSNSLPLKDLDEKKIAYVKLGSGSGASFLESLKKYTNIDYVKSNNLDDLMRKLKPYNLVIIGYHNSGKWYKKHRFKKEELVWLYEIARKHNVILNVLAKPYSLMGVKTVKNVEAIVVSYQNTKISQQKSAQLIFGAIGAKGVLPVTIGDHFKAGDGFFFNPLKRLSYGLPERVDMNSLKLKKIDSVARLAVDSLMTPGLQLLVARKGKVVYDKSFGRHTYNEDSKKVEWSDLYDVASLTKILATLPLVMEMEEFGDVSLNSRLSDLLPEYEGTDKKNITLKEMLSHYARLQSWIPFYLSTINEDTKLPDSLYYRKKKVDSYTVKVAEDLFLRKDFKDSIQRVILDSKLLHNQEYRYSDLPYYILKKFIETYHDYNLDELVKMNFYYHIGANRTTYNPLAFFDKRVIVPSEVDDYFRYQEVHGYVNDSGAAMQGGIGGHAGIFSNANDVAKIMQMYLQNGYYGGEQYFKPETIDRFNTCYYCENKVRRGVGFDKPQLEEEGPTCGCVSMTSFGHSGFTGAYTWADPEEEIVYVFLANRTYPDANDNKLLRENIRTDIQKLIYESIIN